MSAVSFCPSVWGPHYWYFLHTIAHSYPEQPSTTMQKKYYEFYQDLPIFIPVESIGNSFASLLDRYPVTAYLDSRASLVRWTRFIHNKVNEKLGKSTLSPQEANDVYITSLPPKRQTPKPYKMAIERSLYAYACAALLVGGIALHKRR